MKSSNEAQDAQAVKLHGGIIKKVRACGSAYTYVYIYLSMPIQLTSRNRNSPSLMCLFIH